MTTGFHYEVVPPPPMLVTIRSRDLCARTEVGLAHAGLDHETGAIVRGGGTAALELSGGLVAGAELAR